LKRIYSIILKHYLIGILVVFIGFWSIGEIPRWYTVKRDLMEWVITVLSIPAVGLLISWLIDKRLKKNQKNIYLHSVLMIFLTWIFLLYSIALIMGIIITIEYGRERILESIAGATIYRLWLYGGLGIIHGLTGGILLAIDLKKYTTAHNTVNDN